MELWIALDELKKGKVCNFALKIEQGKIHEN